MLSRSGEAVPMGRARLRNRGPAVAQGSRAMAEGGGDHVEIGPQVSALSCAQLLVFLALPLFLSIPSKAKQCGGTNTECRHTFTGRKNSA